MLCLEGTGGFTIPYLGYIEATVGIPPIKGHDECVPMLVQKSSAPYNSRVPIQFGTTVLDRAMGRITLEELAYASNTWWQTYMSTMVTAKVADMVEIKNDDILTIDTPFVTTEPTMIPSFGCNRVKGLVALLPAHSYWVNIIAEPIESHQITLEVKATSTYGDLHWLKKGGHDVAELICLWGQNSS